MAGSDDDELLAAVRAGDRVAYGVLYARHAPSARRYARSLLANDPDADDAVGEVFAHLLQAIERGRGPDHTFAAYLFASVRHECVRIERRRSREALERSERRASEPRAATGDHAAGVAEAAVVRAAFASLPGDMRDILRLTEVDQLPQQEIATRLDEDPGTVATRAMRARRALGSAYLLQHVGIGGRRHLPGRGCDDTRAHIASFLRGTAGARRRARIEEHLVACEGCRAEFADLRQINGHLRSFTFAVLATLRTAGETAWSHLSAAVAASAAPLAATGAITATTLAPVVVTPPAPPAVVADAPVRSTVGVHLAPDVVPPPALLLEAIIAATATEQPAVDVSASGDGEPTRLPVTGAAARPAVAEAVPVLPSVPAAAALPDTEVAVAPAADLEQAPAPAAGTSPTAPAVVTTIDSPPLSATPQEPPPAAEVPAPEPAPAPATAPPAVAPATDPPPPPPPAEPPAGDDGGAATIVPRKDPKGGASDDDPGKGQAMLPIKGGPRAEKAAAAT